MSVTIYPTQPDTLRRYPRTERIVPCDMCSRGICQPGWCETGLERVQEPTAPEVNFANANARALLVALGLDAGEHLCGAIDATEIHGAIAECEAALASTATGLVLRAPMLRAPAHGSRYVVAGSDDARALERLAEVLGVLRWALAHGSGIAWD